MFPLETVLFPHAMLDLHVFEPRYQALVRDLLTGDCEFGIVLIERGRDVGGGDTRFDVGTLSRLVSCDQLFDGEFALTTLGISRIRILDWLAEQPYPRALVTEDDRNELRKDDALHLREVEARLRDLLALYKESGLHDVAGALPNLDVDIAIASFQLCQLSPLGPIDAQKLLTCDSVGQRLVLLCDLLDDQLVILRSGLADS